MYKRIEYKNKVNCGSVEVVVSENICNACLVVVLIVASFINKTLFCNINETVQSTNTAALRYKLLISNDNLEI